MDKVEKDLIVALINYFAEHTTEDLTQLLSDIVDIEAIEAIEAWYGF